MLGVAWWNLTCGSQSGRIQHALITSHSYVRVMQLLKAVNNP